MARWLPRPTVLKLATKAFWRDAKGAAMTADSLIADEAEPAATVAANERLAREFPKLRLPLLILRGAGKLARQPRSRRFMQAAGSNDKVLRI